MIKNFDEFVNGNEQITEGRFIDNIMHSLAAGIAAFKSGRHMEKSIKKDNDEITMTKILDGGSYDDDTKLAILVDGLLARAVWLAEYYTDNQETGLNNDLVESYMERIENIISKIRELTVDKKTKWGTKEHDWRKSIEK
jgi:hypothetical protein